MARNEVLEKIKTSLGEMPRFQQGDLLRKLRAEGYISTLEQGKLIGEMDKMEVLRVDGLDKILGGETHKNEKEKEKNVLASLAQFIHLVAAAESVGDIKLAYDLAESLREVVSGDLVSAMKELVTIKVIFNQ